MEIINKGGTVHKGDKDVNVTGVIGVSKAQAGPKTSKPDATITGVKNFGSGTVTVNGKRQ